MRLRLSMLQYGTVMRAKILSFFLWADGGFPFVVSFVVLRFVVLRFAKAKPPRMSHIRSEMQRNAVITVATPTHPGLSPSRENISAVKGSHWSLFLETGAPPWGVVPAVSAPRQYPEGGSNRKR
ncbi:hypothetical protein FPOAC2_07694 [Fusarium poae]